MALAMHSSCKDSLRTIGYIPMDEIEPAVLSIDSAPTGAQVFAGPTAAELKPIGVAPMKIPHPKNNRGWLPECYQAKKPGHGDSAVDCRGKEWGDRDVTLPLKTPEK